MIMIEVVLLCLSAHALNIPHLGHDRPSDPELTKPSSMSGTPQCTWGTHSDNNYVSHFTIACYMFCMFHCGQVILYHPLCHCVVLHFGAQCGAGGNFISTMFHNGVAQVPGVLHFGTQCGA